MALATPTIAERRSRPCEGRCCRAIRPSGSLSQRVLEEQKSPLGAIDRAVCGDGLADEPGKISGGDSIGVSHHAAGGSLHGGDALGGDRDLHGLGVPYESEGGEGLRRPKIVL